MKYRIVAVETHFMHVGLIRKYAVQKRAGLFWWVTVGYCDSLQMAVTLRDNLARKPKDNVIRVVFK